MNNEQYRIILKALGGRLGFLQENERRSPHPLRAAEIEEIKKLIAEITHIIR